MKDYILKKKKKLVKKDLKKQEIKRSLEFQTMVGSYHIENKVPMFHHSFLELSSM